MIQVETEIRLRLKTALVAKNAATGEVDTAYWDGFACALRWALSPGGAVRFPCIGCGRETLPGEPHCSRCKYRHGVTDVKITGDAV
jgi:hypothetical protein